MRSILVTSAGSGVGQAIFDAMGCSVHNYRLIVLNSHALSPIFRRAHAAYISPKTSQQEAFMDCLRTVVATENPELILAGRDEEIEQLSVFKSDFEAMGSMVPVASHHLMRVCTDKYLSWIHLGRILPFVETAFTPTEIQSLLADWGFPVLLKPRCGFGSRGVLVVHTQALLDAFLAEAQEPYVVQPFLARPVQTDEDEQWPEHSGQILIGAEGAVLGVFASRVRIAQGLTTHLESLKLDSPFGQSLQAMAEAMALYGLRGNYNIQAIETEHKGFQIIEVNARCTGLTGIRAQMGFNELDMLYDSFIQGKASLPTIGSPRLAVMQTRFEQLSL